MTEPVTTFTKRRDAATPGSIPDVLQMFTREVRFYREVAPDVGVRTPACSPRRGARRRDPPRARGPLVVAARARTPRSPPGCSVTCTSRWEGRAVERWPWLPRPDLGDLVGELYDEAWASARERPELTPARP